MDTRSITSKPKVRLISPNSKGKLMEQTKVKQCQALNKIKEIYMKKQPERIKQFLEQENFI
jgi:hypothetical protein